MLLYVHLGWPTWRQSRADDRKGQGRWRTSRRAPSGRAGRSSGSGSPGRIRSSTCRRAWARPTSSRASWPPSAPARSSRSTARASTRARIWPRRQPARAIGALRGWSFAAARGRLDEAGERAHDPALQQRVALFKALTRLLSALIYTPLDEKPRGGLGDLDGVLAGLDRLTAEERLHYRDEADRLLNLRETAAGGDPFLAAAWTLIRVRLALAAGQDEAAIVWLLHLAARHAPAATAAPGGAEGYLGTLLGRARAHLLARIGVADPAGPEDGAAPAKNGAPHPRELSNALVAHLSDAFGRDLARGTELFALNEYVAADG